MIGSIVYQKKNLEKISPYLQEAYQDKDWPKVKKVLLGIHSHIFERQVMPIKKVFTNKQKLANYIKKIDTSTMNFEIYTKQLSAKRNKYLFYAQLKPFDLHQDTLKTFHSLSYKSQQFILKNMDHEIANFETILKTATLPVAQRALDYARDLRAKGIKKLLLNFATRLI